MLPAVVRRAILALPAAAGHWLVRGARARGAPRAAVLDILLDINNGNHILVSRLPQDLNLLLHDGRRLIAKAAEVDNLDRDRAISGGAACISDLAIGAHACVGGWCDPRAVTRRSEQKK